MLKPTSTGKARAGETCHDCGKVFKEGERITQHWAFGELHAKTCRNTVACEKRMPEQAEKKNAQTS